MPTHPFAAPPQQRQFELHFQPPQPPPNVPDVEVSSNKRPGPDDGGQPGQRIKKSEAVLRIPEHIAEAMQAEAAAAASQLEHEDWAYIDPDEILAYRNIAKHRTADPDIARDLAMQGPFGNKEFMKQLRKQAEKEGLGIDAMKERWIEQMLKWMQPAKTKKTRQASRSATPAAPVPVPSEAPAAEEEKARPTKSETAKPKPSRAPRAQSARARKREESIETVPSASVPPTSRLQPEEEGGPKPKARARLGKTAKALKETQQAKKARIMEIEMDKRIQEAKKRGRQAARSAPPMPVILPTADDQEAVYKFDPAVVAQARQELEAARQRSASAKKGKKEATPSPAPKQTVKKPRANSGSTAPHRTTLPVNALTGHGKPKVKWRPRKTPLETIPEIPAPIKKGRGRPKKVVVVDNRLVVPSPILPYKDVGNDPYLIKSH